MSLKEICQYQKDFDKRYFRKWNESATKSEFLQSMLVALIGEVGEFANIVKKAVRDEKTLGKTLDGDTIGKLKEELADCFIYTVILGNILEMDLEEEYYKKMKFNEKRFEKYRDVK
jgi:NTP pyrophosphatase (non-canonical NTP hydrolase)